MIEREPPDDGPEPPAYEGFVLAWFHSGSPTPPYIDEDGTEVGRTHHLYRGKTALMSPYDLLDRPQASLRAIVALLRDGFRIVIGRVRDSENG